MAESEEALQLKRRARRRLVGALALVTFIVIILPLLLDKEPGPAGPPLDVQIPKQDPGGFAARIGPPGAQPPIAAALAPEKKAETSPAKPEPPAGNLAESPKKAEQAAAKPEQAAAESEQTSAKTVQSPAKAKQGDAKAGSSAGKAETQTASAATPKAAPAMGDKPAAVPAKASSDTEQERAQAALRDEAWAVSLDAFSELKNVKLLRAKLSAAGVKSYTEPVKTSKGELTSVRAGPFDSKEAAEKARAKLEAMGLKPGAVASR